MQYFTLTLLICLLICVYVSAVPVDESLPEDTYGHADTYNPQQPQAIFKLKKLKKLLLG